MDIEGSSVDHTYADVNKGTLRLLRDYTSLSTVCVILLMDKVALNPLISQGSSASHTTGWETVRSSSSMPNSMTLNLTRGVTSFALYCILENKSIKSAISSLFLAVRPEAVKPPAAEGDAAIITPRLPVAVASSRTRPPSNTAEPGPLEREDRPGHPFPASFFLTARLRGPEPGSLLEFRAPASGSTLPTRPGVQLALPGVSTRLTG